MRLRIALAFVAACAISFGQTPASSHDRRFALVIGNNSYRNVTALKTAVNDARSLQNILRDRYCFETTLLTDATRSQIMTALGRYRRTLDADSSLLIYYAGHGYQDAGVDKSYWWPVNAEKDNVAEWISSDDITTAIRALPARHVLIVSDSCFSGTLTRGAILPEPPPSGSDRSRSLDKLRERHSRQLFASGGNEPVADGGAGDHSVFAGALLRSLQEMTQPEFPVEELFRDVRESVAGRSAQVPELDPIRNSGHDGGSFIFGRTAPSLKPSPGQPAVDSAPKPPLSAVQMTNLARLISGAGFLDACTLRIFKKSSTGATPEEFETLIPLGRVKEVKRASNTILVTAEPNSIRERDTKLVNTIPTVIHTFDKNSASLAAGNGGAADAIGLLLIQVAACDLSRPK